MTSIETSVLGEAIQAAIGETEVQALVFTTHDLDPQFFEEEILPVFLGNDLKHTQRTRQLQLEQEIREREVDIDVYYEGRALAVHEGSARLGWSRLQMVNKSGVFHPKVVLALCADADGTEQLVVSVASANLNRGGWWTNLECADVVTIEDGERHGYRSGLLTLVDQLLNSASTLPNHRATTRVRAFLRRQPTYRNASVNGVLLPTVIPGRRSLPGTLLELFGRSLEDLHLEVISPFFDGDPLAPDGALETLLSTLSPYSTTIALPMLSGDTPVAEDVYRRIRDDPRVNWGRIPAQYAKRADGVDAGDRSVHAKVYRFWRGAPNAREVVVVGSHNLSKAAHTGTYNFEVSVVHEVVGGRQTRLLEPLEVVPQAFGILDTEGEDDEPLTLPLPLSLAYNWETGQAQARWDSTTTPKPVTISRAGETLMRVELTEGNRTQVLNEESADHLRDLLRVSCVVTATTDEGAEGPLLVIELHHDLKPALIEGMDLTPAEILALWSIPGLRDRLRRIGRTRAKRRDNEPDLEHGDTVPPVAVSMFEQFAGVFHAFASLRTRIDRAVQEKRLRPAALLLYGQNLDSPSTVLAMVADQAEDDPALAYVTFRMARELVDGVAHAHPGLATALPTQAEHLAELLGRTEVLRRLVLESAPAPEQAGLSEFLDWFDNQFGAEDTEVSR